MDIIALLTAILGLFSTIIGLPAQISDNPLSRWLAIFALLGCLIWGFVRLGQDGSEPMTLVLLFVGCLGLSLSCLYYAMFWKPQKRGARSSKQIRRLAIIGIFAIPLLTGGIFLGWQLLPPNKVLLLVAEFDGTDQKKYRVAEHILNKLQDATEEYKQDVKVQPIAQSIIQMQGGSEDARAIGERKKASIVIWGDYSTPGHVKINAHFELLKPLINRESIRITQEKSAISELNSFTLQTQLSQEMSYLTLFTLGMVQYAKGDWDGVLNRFKSALNEVKESKTAPDKEVLYFYQGTCNYHKHNYPEAITDYNQAIKLKPDFAEAYNNRGNVHSDQGNYPQAIADYDKAIKFKPDFAEAHYNRGNVHSDQGNYPQAIADYDKAIKFKPDFANAYSNRGKVYSDQGNYPRAIEDYNQAIKLKPDFAEAHNNRGNAYGDQGNYPQAIEDYSKAIELKPDFAEAYNNRGLAHGDQGNYSQAIEDYSKAIELKPDFADAYYNSACTYSLKKESRLAIENLKRAIQLDAKKRDLAKTDSDFDNIRKDKHFQTLLGK